MFKFFVISFVLLAGQVCSIRLKRSLDEQDDYDEDDYEEADEDTRNPEELSGRYQGDILLPTRPSFRNGATWQSARWPNATVPYEIVGNFNTREKSIIMDAFKNYHRYTCIRFVPRTTEKDYVSFVSENVGCLSFVGRTGGKQTLNLQSPGCFVKPGTAMHEMMHALGFFHEQNRVDRDDFVSIHYENLSPEHKSFFDVAPNTYAYGVPYDYSSVMHYSTKAFSANGQPTIVPLKDLGKIEMGQRDGFSPSDIIKLNKMYDCDNVAPPA